MVVLVVQMVVTSRQLMVLTHQSELESQAKEIMVVLHQEMVGKQAVAVAVLVQQVPTEVTMALSLSVEMVALEQPHP
jgi:hypothetical protein